MTAEISPIEAINEFYKLKDKYEMDYYDSNIKPIFQKYKSNREKRVAFSKLPKHKCVNCHREVGTIFKVGIDQDIAARKYTAKCGDLAEPCPLNIEITHSLRFTYETTIHDGLDTINKLKMKIIKEKNNALFFGKEVLNSFEVLTNELKKETQFTGRVIESNILKNDNPEKEALLKKSIDEFSKGFVAPFNKMIEDYVSTENELVVNQAVNFYITEMLPKLKEIQKLKYEVNYVEYVENYDTSDKIRNAYVLVQKPNTLENLEYVQDSSSDKVIQFVKGVKKDARKTLKNKKETKKPSNKTRKILRDVNLVIEEDENEPEVREETEPIE